VTTTYKTDFGKALEEKKPRGEVEWRIQAVPPRDQFETCTLTIEQWLANTDTDGYGLDSKAAKWRAVMKACALALPGVQRQDGLRQEPRVGFDPIGDQPYFIFKASNNGTTFLVSPEGLNFDKDEVFPPSDDPSPARCRLELILVELPEPQSRSHYTSATGRLMAVSDGFDPIGPVLEYENGHKYADRVNIGCPVCGAYVLILASDYKHTDQVHARCLAGCAPELLARAIGQRVREKEGRSS
jgi:hypothetical protein